MIGGENYFPSIFYCWFLFWTEQTRLVEGRKVFGLLVVLGVGFVLQPILNGRGFPVQILLQDASPDAQNKDSDIVLTWFSNSLGSPLLLHSLQFIWFFLSLSQKKRKERKGKERKERKKERKKRERKIKNICLTYHVKLVHKIVGLFFFVSHKPWKAHSVSRSMLARSLLTLSPLYRPAGVMQLRFASSAAHHGHHDEHHDEHLDEGLDENGKPKPYSIAQGREKRGFLWGEVCFMLHFFYLFEFSSFALFCQV